MSGFLFQSISTFIVIVLNLCQFMEHYHFMMLNLYARIWHVNVYVDLFKCTFVPYRVLNFSLNSFDMFLVKFIRMYFVF